MNWLVTITGSDRETLYYTGGQTIWSKHRGDAVPLDSGVAHRLARNHNGKMWPYDLPVLVGTSSP